MRTFEISGSRHLNKTIVSIGLCVALFFAGKVFAEQKLTLLDAYLSARSNDPNIAIARLKVEGAEAQRDVARGKLLPQISLFGEWSENEIRYENTGTTSFSDQRYPGERYGLQLRSALFNVTSFREHERVGSLLDEARERLNMAESELLSSVVSAYLTVLLTAESLRQYETELAALEEQLKQAQALYDRSLLPITQVLETQTRADTLRADVVDARGQVLVSRERLARFTGIREFETEDISSSIMLTSSVTGPEEAAALAVEADPAVAAAVQAELAAKKAVEREKGSFFPEVDFVFNSQYSDVGFDNLSSPARNTDSYSISFRYPLFEGGAGAARLRATRAEFYSAQKVSEYARREASGRARAAWLNQESSIERVLAARQAVKTATVNLEAARKAVKAGAARFTDVLVALAQKTGAERDLSDARFQQAAGWLELQLSTGNDPFAVAPTFSRALHGR